MTSRKRKPTVTRAQRRQLEQQRIARLRARTRVAISAIVAGAVVLLAPRAGLGPDLADDVAAETFLAAFDQRAHRELCWAV